MRETGVLPVISDFVLDELAFWVMKQGAAKESQGTPLSWRQVLRSRPDLAQTLVEQAAAKRADLERRALKLPIPDSVTDRAFQLMHDHALLPTDAYHIATALENEVPACVTLDEDFLTVEGLIVYTCLP
jgi:predicted nucleic acid-binding protein